MQPTQIMRPTVISTDTLKEKALEPGMVLKQGSGYKTETDKPFLVYLLHECLYGGI